MKVEQVKRGVYESKVGGALRGRRRIRIAVEQVAHHRNGVGGQPFHVVLFRHDPDGIGERRFVATVFSPTAGCEIVTGQCAVLEVEMLAAGDVAFGSNSWRGDDFEPLLRRAITEEAWS